MEEEGTAGRLCGVKPLLKPLQPVGTATGGTGWPVHRAELQLSPYRVCSCGHGRLSAGCSVFLGSSCKALKWGRGPAEGQENVGWVAAVPRGRWWLLRLPQLEFISQPGMVYWEAILLCPQHRFTSLEHVTWYHLPAENRGSGAGVPPL